MGFVVPNALEVEVLTTLLTPALTLKLFSNNATPSGASNAASFTEVVGGGYVSLPLTFANWAITGGDPSQGVYNAIQTWIFTGPTGGPGTIYGYFVTRNSDGKLYLAERFAPAIVPFSPVNGSKVQILPKFSAQSEF